MWMIRNAIITRRTGKLKGLSEENNNLKIYVNTVNQKMALRKNINIIMILRV